MSIDIDLATFLGIEFVGYRGAGCCRQIAE